MAGFWIAVAMREHVAAGERAGVFAASHGSHAAAARPAEGDRFAYYAPRESLGGDPVQAFVALGTITDGAPTEREVGGARLAVRLAAYEPVAEAAVKPLLPRLGFVRDPAHWGMAFRQGLFAVSADDFAVIEAALKSDG